MHKRGLMFLCLLGVSGCATTPPAVTRNDVLTALQKIQLGAHASQTTPQYRAAVAAAAGGGLPNFTEQNELDDAYQKMMAYCSITLTKFEQKSTKVAYWTAGIAIVGSLAGSVAVPALTAAASANKVWIAGLGGVSGVANAGQQAFSNAGISSQLLLQTREKVLTDWKADIVNYYDSSKSLEDRRISIEKSYADCELYEISTTPTQTAVGAQK